MLTRQGKSSLTVQFVERHFVESYYPTIENTFSKVIKYRGQDFATEIVDTAGQVSASASHIDPKRPAAAIRPPDSTMPLGRIQHPQLQTLYRHPWLHARLLRGLSAIL